MTKLMITEVNVWFVWAIPEIHWFYHVDIYAYVILVLIHSDIRWGQIILIEQVTQLITMIRLIIVQFAELLSEHCCKYVQFKKVLQVRWI